MNFNRKNFYGLTFDWYMVDAVGSIAMFMSGYGPIPRSVFKDENDYTILNDFLKNIPALTESYYSPLFQEISINTQNNFFSEVKAVSRGIYVYDNEEYTNNYNLVAIPQTKLNYSELPLNIKQLLNPFMFEDIIFNEMKALNIENYFACE